MQQEICRNTDCGGTLTPGDQFCGDCGTPVWNWERDTQAKIPETQTAASETWSGWSSKPSSQENSAPGRGSQENSTAFFSHHPRIPAVRLSNATRHLCAAAYLSRGFANRVVAEIVSSRRAVAPSVDIDLGPVIRHCLRARRNLLIRDMLLILVVVIGLIINPPSTVAFVLIAVAFGALIPMLFRPRGDGTRKVITAIFLVYILINVVSLAILLALSALFSAMESGNGLSSVPSSEFHAAIPFLIVLALAWGVQYGFALATNRALIEQSRHGAAPPSPQSGPVEDRIALAEGAQWGNITLYGKEDPFVGAGDYKWDEHWSIAIKLTPAKPLRRLMGGLPDADEYVPIDPVALHQHLRERLLKLNDPDLPTNERIAALRVTDRLVGSGWLRWDGPLIDPVRKTPYSWASQDAIDSVIRHPQAGLRYYQQVSVSDEGLPVIRDDRLVLNGVDQGVAVTAFVYAAVEGRMFYLQYVISVLPPVKAEFKSVEIWPDLPPLAFHAAVLRRSFLSMFGAIAYVPSGLYQAFKHRRREPSGPRRHGPVVGDLGATVSVRELGSESSLGNYLRELDAEKYNKVFQRLILESVKDFLIANEVDISAFEGGADTIVNGDVIRIGQMSGSNHQVGSHGNTHNSRIKERA